MWRWLTIPYWRRRFALLNHRERLALLLWPYLSPTERSVDEAAPLALLVRTVRAIETGADQFPEDPPARQLWQQAGADPHVRQAAAALRTLRLQMLGTTPSSTPIESVSKKELRPLQMRMKADRLADDRGWLQQPLTLPLASTLFLFSGYLFNTILFGHFGLPVGRYFGLSDYLAASIDGLIPATIAVVFVVVLQLLVKSRVRLKALQNRLGKTWRHTGETVLIFGALTFLWTLQDASDQQRIQIIYTLMIGFPMLLLPSILAFSLRPARDTVLLSFAAVYLAITWFSAERRYINLMGSDQGTEITLAAAPNKALPWRVISGNSLYLFLLNEEQEVVAVPVQQVVSIRYIKENEDEP